MHNLPCDWMLSIYNVNIMDIFLQVDFRTQWLSEESDFWSFSKCFVEGLSKKTRVKVKYQLKICV